MALFKKKQFEELANEKGKYCISIYIPTQRGGENKESVIHLKNEIANIQKELSGFGLKQKEIDPYINPMKKLLEDVNIWRHLSDTLAIFSSKNRFEYYTLPLKGLQNFSQVSDRFYTLPLINIFNEDNRFFILALSLKNNRLYEATQYEISEIETGDSLPDTMYDSAGHDVVQKSLQMRGEQTGSEGSAMYHGKGEGKDDKEVEIQKYLEDVDAGLKEVLDDYETPLVVAAVDNVFAHFKEISKFKNIFPKNVPGNYDNNDILDIHEKAMDILTPYFDKAKNEKKTNYTEANGRTTASLEDIVVSADAGRIDTLFVARDEHIWGEYDREAGKIDKHEKKQEMDNCLLNFAARSVFLKGGKVFIEEKENLPENTAPANAILRY